MSRSERKAIRPAVAEYMQSEGCSCCQNIEKHNKDRDGGMTWFIIAVAVLLILVMNPPMD